MNFDNDAGPAPTCRGMLGFSYDSDPHAMERPNRKEFYNWRLRRMHRDAQ